MVSRDITQQQAWDLLYPLFEYLGIDPQDVSKVEFTASAVDITRYIDQYGFAKQHIAYVGGN
jgi:hypothetical protein